MAATGTETLDAAYLVCDTLNADAQVGQPGTGSLGFLGWFKDMAELPTPLPTDAIYGIVGWQGGVRVTYPGPNFVALYGLLMVKLVGPTSKMKATLRPGYKRVYTVLDASTPANSDITMFGKMYEELPIDYTETPAGAPRISHLGGAWRILAG
jgi:hypothetical protein